jgi:hypothetical protein
LPAPGPNRRGCCHRKQHGFFFLHAIAFYRRLKREAAGDQAPWPPRPVRPGRPKHAPPSPRSAARSIEKVSRHHAMAAVGRARRGDGQPGGRFLRAAAASSLQALPTGRPPAAAPYVPSYVPPRKPQHRHVGAPGTKAWFGTVAYIYITFLLDTELATGIWGASVSQSTHTHGAFCSTLRSALLELSSWYCIIMPVADDNANEEGAPAAGRPGGRAAAVLRNPCRLSTQSYLGPGFAGAGGRRECFWGWHRGSSSSSTNPTDDRADGRRLARVRVGAGGW